MAATRGLCWCGCGQPTALAVRTSNERGDVEGEPVRYVYGHASRKSPLEYAPEDRGYDTHCWIWQRATNDLGYGQITVNGVLCYAHRLYYERARGPIPNGLELDHLCQVPPCVNPDHLEAVTHAENMGRARRGRKLTASSAQEIRELVREGNFTQWRIAERYGVSESMVSKIACGKAWPEDFCSIEAGIL